MKVMVGAAATMRPVPGVTIHASRVTSMAANIMQPMIGVIPLRATEAGVRQRHWPARWASVFKADVSLPADTEKRKKRLKRPLLSGRKRR